MPAGKATASSRAVRQNLGREQEATTGHPVDFYEYSLSIFALSMRLEGLRAGGRLNGRRSRAGKLCPVRAVMLKGILRYSFQAAQSGGRYRQDPEQ